LTWIEKSFSSAVQLFICEDIVACAENTITLLLFTRRCLATAGCWDHNYCFERIYYNIALEISSMEEEKQLKFWHYPGQCWTLTLSSGIVESAPCVSEMSLCSVATNWSTVNSDSLHLCTNVKADLSCTSVHLRACSKILQLPVTCCCF
jgi:hypothetical protein